MFSTLEIVSNCKRHFSVAPPCCSPLREPTPAEIAAYGFASDDPATLTLVVDGP